MPRTARIVIPDYPYHVVQRGNYQQTVFFDDADHLKYLSWICEYSEKYTMSILAYCLMSNHVHFIVIPHKEDSLAKAFSVCHMRYAQDQHRKRNLNGHFWQERFYSCLLEEDHLLAAIRYVECNPVQAKLVKKAWEWEWSSAAYHTGHKRINSALKPIEDYTDQDTYSWFQILDSYEVEE